MTSPAYKAGGALPVALTSLYNPLMKDGFPPARGAGLSGSWYPFSSEKAAADLGLKVLFFTVLSHLTGASFSLSVRHVLDLHPAFFELAKNETRDWDSPLTEGEIARLEEPETRYTHPAARRFRVDSLSPKYAGKEGMPVYSRVERANDSKKRRKDVKELLEPYSPAIREEMKISPRALPEQYERPRFLLPPLRRTRAWVSVWQESAASFPVTPEAAESRLSSRDRFWIRGMEGLAFLADLAREMADMLEKSREIGVSGKKNSPARLIVTDEGMGFGLFVPDGERGAEPRYFPKGTSMEHAGLSDVPWLFKTCGMSSLPDPKLRVFFLASLFSRLPFLFKGGAPWRISGITVEKLLPRGKSASVVLLSPAGDAGE